MSPFDAIIVLALVGFLLIAAEVFVPGMVLGILGGICLLSAVIFSYVEYGVITGTITLGIVFAVSLISFIIWMFAFPHTPIGRKVMLQKQLARGDSGVLKLSKLLGCEGETLTPLRPAGKAAIKGRKIDVVAESDFILAGEPVVVVAEEGIRVVVRKKL